LILNGCFSSLSLKLLVAMLDLMWTPLPYRSYLNANMLLLPLSPRCQCSMVPCKICMYCWIEFYVLYPSCEVTSHLKQLTTVKGKGKGKAIPLQAWTGPLGSRRLRLPDF
jgi:hypothetical protein